MGLRIPSDLDEWHSWQARRHVARALKHRVVGARAPEESRATVVHGSDDADIVVLVDATHASMANAVLAPLQFISPERVITVLAPGVQLDVRGTSRLVPMNDIGQHLRSAKVMLGCGEYTGIGAAGWRWARATKAATFVSQHGALTPLAPPLPRDSTLLAWTAPDAEFWRSGRADISHEAVGSQLLWAAAQRRESGCETVGGRLVYLGQGHAAELPRRRMIEGALRVCRTHGAVYRPHPSERDKLSRAAHALFTRIGVTVDTTGAPLAEMSNPVVSVFSTGVLEAAVKGRHAWVELPRPPAWLGEFWERYGMRRLGGLPTPAPDLPTDEPARRIAELIERAAFR